MMRGSEIRVRFDAISFTSVAGVVFCTLCCAAVLLLAAATSSMGATLQAPAEYSTI
jgi:hypothetical protein